MMNTITHPRLVTLLLASGVALNCFAADNTHKIPAQRIINSSGYGEILIPQTQATMKFTITEEGKDPQKIQAIVRTKANTVIESLKSAHPQSIETISLTVNPKLSYADNTSQIVGYTASYAILVKSSISDSGKLIDLALNNGANGMDNPIFAATDNDKERAELTAIKIATQDAQRKANASLASLGLKGITVTQITIQNSEPNRPIPMQFNLMARSNAVASPPNTPIENGQDKVTAQVNLTIAY